jgi:hypothetical protein
MKKALVCPNELVHLPNGDTNWRVADTHATGFEVAPPLFWVDCADDVVADQFSYNLFTKTITAIPAPTPPTPVGDAPNVIA